MEPQKVRYCSACGTRVITQEVFGRLRPVCPACGQVHFQDPKVAASVLVIQEGKVLLVRRVNPPHQGEWALPAGFVDAGEDPREAAARECLEETGLAVRVTDLIDVVSGREHPHGADIVIVYQGEVLAGKLVAGDDACEVGYYAPENLPPLAFDATRRAIQTWLEQQSLDNAVWNRNP